MSDFINNFWSVYITAITLGGIAACALLLWVTSRKKVASNADNTTGHVWDENLQEYNNPMPRWWAVCGRRQCWIRRSWPVRWPRLRRRNLRPRWRWAC